MKVKVGRDRVTSVIMFSASLPPSQLESAEWSYILRTKDPY